VLQVEGLETAYGPLQVLWGIDLRVEPGEIVALIGANGAGKSTFLKTCMGLLRSKGGRIVFDGRDITHKAIHQIVRIGMALVPEGRHVFPDLTVTENLIVAGYGASNPDSAESGRQVAFELFPRLFERRFQNAGTLSGGEQQMLAVARALVCRPRMLLLDEPSLGLAPMLVDQLFDLIKKINDQGTTILLVEQNAFLALDVSRRAYILQNGRVVTTGTSAELMREDNVRESYLGGTVDI